VNAEVVERAERRKCFSSREEGQLTTQDTEALRRTEESHKFAVATSVSSLPPCPLCERSCLVCLGALGVLCVDSPLLNFDFTSRKALTARRSLALTVDKGSDTVCATRRSLLPGTTTNIRQAMRALGEADKLLGVKNP
jgi:hypothetical protein